MGHGKAHRDQGSPPKHQRYIHKGWEGRAPKDPISVMILPQVHLRNRSFPEETFRGSVISKPLGSGHRRLICEPGFWGPG